MDLPDLVVFDLDGTLMDTAPGIIESCNVMARTLDLPPISAEDAPKLLTGTLMSNLATTYGLTGDLLDEGSRIFKEAYAEEGFRNSSPYDGIMETIEALSDAGVRSSVATMKSDNNARLILDFWHMSGLFHSIHGSDNKGLLSKGDLIARCIEEAGTVPEKTVMIGDSPSDMEGARMCGTRFIAASYGYGLPMELCATEGIAYIENPSKLLEILGLRRF